MYKGPYTRAYVRKCAREQGYFIASNARAYPSGWFAEVWVWGWDEEWGRAIACRFTACAEDPVGHCDLPPVGENLWPGNGVRANQLGLDLDWGASQ